MQAGKQANQFDSNQYHNRPDKSSFFSQDSEETCYLIFVSVIRKDISGKYLIPENNKRHIKGIIQLTINNQ